MGVVGGGGVGVVGVVKVVGVARGDKGVDAR